MTAILSVFYLIFSKIYGKNVVTSILEDPCILLLFQKKRSVLSHFWLSVKYLLFIKQSINFECVIAILILYFCFGFQIINYFVDKKCNS